MTANEFSEINKIIYRLVIQLRSVSCDAGMSYSQFFILSCL